MLDELDWESTIDAINVGLAVSDGVVTLSSHVPSYAQKRVAERAVCREAGVKSIANKTDVQLPAQHECSDAELGRAAVQAIEWNAQVPDDAVKIKVDNGWIMLDGSTVTLKKTVASWAEREDVEDTAWSAPGITVVDNDLKASRSTDA